jgi:tRNA (guanine26-N2/guanine27-N2)-dimethyltransferase
MSLAATQAMRDNFIENNIPSSRFKIENSELNQLLSNYSNTHCKFDVVDLDPYGSSMPFLPNALNCVKSDGLLLATFTDKRVLCSHGRREQQVCYYRYGAVPHHMPYTHEQALRICLQAISQAANRASMAIRPLVSLTADFYLRLIVSISKDKSECHKSVE